jgi:predicted nucleic acid-binding Zn ribbon protein
MSPWRPLPGPSGSRGSREPDGPRPVGDSLPDLARRLGAPAPSVLTAVFTRWEEIVGPSIAANAWPVSLSRGVLVVGVEHPGWASQLRFLATDMVANVATVTGSDAVEKVEIKVLARRPNDGPR